MPAEGPRPLPPGGVGLAGGLALARAQLQAHKRDGLRTNLRALRHDKLFLLFLATSCAGFYRVAQREFSELSQERRAAAKLAKAKGVVAQGGDKARAPWPAVALPLAAQPPPLPILTVSSR